jgi:hypothetical protein
MFISVSAVTLPVDVLQQMVVLLDISRSVFHAHDLSSLDREVYDSAYACRHDAFIQRTAFWNHLRLMNKNVPLTLRARRVGRLVDYTSDST